MVGVDVILPMCGRRHFLQSTLRDIKTRACSSVRVIMMGSKSASSDLHVTARCTGGSPEIGVIDRSGKNLLTTGIAKVGTTANSCVYFFSSSSQVNPGFVTSFTDRVSRGLSFITENVACRCPSHSVSFPLGRSHIFAYSRLETLSEGCVLSPSVSVSGAVFITH